MTLFEKITKSAIRDLSSSNNYRQGLQYVKRVRSPKLADGSLSAQVVGHTPYYVQISAELQDEKSKVISIDPKCTCPDSWNKFCKHAVAVLLKWVNEPESFVGYNGPSQPLPHSSATKPPPTTPYTEPPGWMRGEPLPLQAEFSRPAELETLQNWLQKMTLQDLQTLARNGGWSLTARTKSEAVSELSQHLLNEADIQQHFAEQDAEHQQAFFAFSLLLPQRTPTLSEYVLEDLANQPTPLTRYARLNTYTRHLREAGLALPGELQASIPNKLDFVPPSMARRVTATQKSTQVPSLKLSSQLKPHQGDAHHFLQAVHYFLLYLNQQQVPLQAPAPQLPQTNIRNLQTWSYNVKQVEKALKRLNSYYGTGEKIPVQEPPLPFNTTWLKRLQERIGPAEKIDFIYHILLELKIIYPGSPVQVWAESYNAFMRLSQAQQRALLAQAYFNTALWTSYWSLLRADKKLQMKLLPQKQVVPSQSEALTNWCNLRQSIIYVLTHLPENSWLDYKQLKAIFEILHPRLNVLPNDPRFRVEYRQKGNKTWHDHRDIHWDEKIGRFIESILTGPLHWLGLLDYALNPANGQIKAIRLRGLAHCFFEPYTQPPPLSEDTSVSLTVPPSALQIVDAKTISLHIQQSPPQAHLLLQKIASLGQTINGRQSYHLSLKDFHRSLENGLSTAKLQADWADLMPHAMPKAIQEQLSQWENSYHRLLVYHNVTTLEFAEDYIAQEVKAITSLEDHILAEITPRLVVIPLEAAYIIKQELTAAGHTPSDNLPPQETT